MPPRSPGFIARDHVIKKIREMGFSHRQHTLRIDLFRRGTDRLEDPRKDYLDPRWVRSALKQQGLAVEEIESFIRLATA